MITAEPKPMSYRPYQGECFDACHAGLIEFDRGLVVAATGSGKAVIMSKLAGDAVDRRGSFCTGNGKVLILINREELLQQAAAQVTKVTGIYASIERAHQHATLEAPIIIATIQSIQRRMQKYEPGSFGLVIVDEAHLFASPKIVEVLDFFCHENGAKLIGFTATPHTKGKRALGKIYQTILFEKGIASLIQEKWLCNIKVQSVPIKIDLSGVRSAAGDYIDEDLDGVVTPYFVEMAKEMRAHPDRKWLCFLPLIKTSQHFADVLNANGISAQHVDGKSEDRREILLGFKDGKFQALSNSLLVTTGYDEPSITGIVNLRPTRSRIMLQQIIGRGTRLKPEGSPHDDLLILDPLWQAPELQELMSPAILFATNEEDEKEVKKRAQNGDVQDLMELHAQVVQDRHKKLADALKANEKKLGKLLDFAAILATGIKQDPLFDEVIDYEPTMPHHTKKPTEGQLNTLTKMGVDIRVIKDFGHASAMMAFMVSRIHRGLASIKQVRCLQKANKVVDPNTLTFKDASAMIGRMYGGR